MALLPSYTIDKSITAQYQRAESLRPYPFQDQEAPRGDDTGSNYVVLEWNEVAERFLTTVQPDGNRSGRRVHYRGKPSFRCFGEGKKQAQEIALLVNDAFKSLVVVGSEDNLAGLLKWRYFSDYSGKGEGTDYEYVVIFEIEFWILESE